MIRTTSDPAFRVLHALRIKGFAKPSAVAQLTGLGDDEVRERLDTMATAGLVARREARDQWQLTPDGVAAHHAALAAERTSTGVALADLARASGDFADLNLRFKQLCGAWQTRDGAPNDHGDRDYDAAVIARLVELDADAAPVIERLGGVLGRFAPYGERLAATCRRVADGETKMFTGVMCGSYHDVWMELHEDLIVTQRAERSMEGAF